MHISMNFKKVNPLIYVGAISLIILSFISLKTVMQLLLLISIIFFSLVFIIKMTRFVFSISYKLIMGIVSIIAFIAALGFLMMLFNGEFF